MSDIQHAVLVVDDDPTTREVLTACLERASIPAVACAGGAEMWELLDRHHPELVLLDVQMPGDDGFALAEELRARFGYGIAIVMLTGRDRAQDIAAGMDVGADEYLVKPCDRQLLVSVVRRNLHSHAQTIGN